MKKASILVLSILLISFTSCNDRNKKMDPQTPGLNPESEVSQRDNTRNTNRNDNRNNDRNDNRKEYRVDMRSVSNSNVKGTVVFTENNGKVKMRGNFTGLNPDKKHAIHLHEKADCSAQDGSSAGDHWNPTNENHGKWEDSDGYHQGDIGNLNTDKNGNATITFETEEWCIGCNDNQKNILGKGIIVHTDQDDFKTQPTGNAGGRIACGEIKDYR